MTIGKGGVPERRYQRETYYVCDLGQGGRGRRLVQTKLSFKTGTGQQAVEENKLFNSVNTHKEGQHGLSINHGGVTDEKELVDENR